MDLLPAAINRLIALGCLAGIAAYFTWAPDGQESPRARAEWLEGVLPSHG